MFRANLIHFNLTHKKFTGTISPKGSVQLWSCDKVVAYVFPHEAEPSSAIRTGQYLLD